MSRVGPEHRPGLGLAGEPSEDLGSGLSPGPALSCLSRRSGRR